MTRINFAIGPYRGGGPRNVYTLSKLLSDAGYNSEVIRFVNPSYFDFLSENTMKVPSIGAKLSSPGILKSFSNITFELIYKIPATLLLPIVTFSLITRTLTLSKYNKADLYIATDWGSFFPTFLVSQRRGSPMLYFVQAEESTFNNDPSYKMMAINTYRTPVKRITQSKLLKEILDKKYGGITHYIGFGINPSFFLPLIQNKENIIFTIARKSYDKGFDIFVNAINYLWNKRKDFSVMIAGDPGAISTQKVLFPFSYLGWITDDREMASIYNKSIFVHTGRFEALPMPVLEAMASGSSVVISDIPGNAEFSEPYKNCLVSKADNYVSVANNIESLIDNAELRRTISNGGRITAKNYRLELVIQRLKSILDKEFGI